ncbi:hypothetical protein P879_02011 [Paragonimus westermani]|uniref:Uncharacterized protein n=1 Tax=Paragonimus westermani TaxID=34504 RepID=A0A8T0DSW4_9TREM|nr:hypothetical protein P879_02011 [Paragonimus westermani]
MAHNSNSLNSTTLPSTSLGLKDLRIVQLPNPDRTRTCALLSKVTDLLNAFEKSPPQPFEGPSTDGRSIELDLFIPSVCDTLEDNGLRLEDVRFDDQDEFSVNSDSSVSSSSSSSVSTRSVNTDSADMNPLSSVVRLPSGAGANARPRIEELSSCDSPNRLESKHCQSISGLSTSRH